MSSSQDTEEQKPKTEYGIDPETKEHYMKANYPWMRNIAQEIIEGREAKAKLKVKEVEVDSCWSKVEEYTSVIDSLEHAALIADRQSKLRDRIINNKDIAIKDLEKEVSKEKVQKWGILGGGAGALILAIALGLALGL